jgi:hypothetical protein
MQKEKKGIFQGKTKNIQSSFRAEREICRLNNQVSPTSMWFEMTIVVLRRRTILGFNKFQ